MWRVLLTAMFFAGSLRAGAVDGSLAFKGDGADAQAAFLAALLQGDASVSFKLPDSASTSRNSQGRWVGAALEAALLSQGNLAFHGDASLAQKGSAAAAAVWSAKRPGGTVSLVCDGMPKVLLLENSSTVSPLSKGLAGWAWPFTVRSFADAEADPQKVFDPAGADIVVFSSPGWWGDFADPPGGPSRVGDAVAGAVRNFVHQGGTALFIDIAQWDLEKIWPKSVSLAPLGPYSISKLNFGRTLKGGMSLSPVGVGADRLRGQDAFTLIGNPNFAYPDGSSNPVSAAWAMPDPASGQGWVAGFAFHVFDQDDTLTPAVRRLLINTLLLSGSRRIHPQGASPLPSPPPLENSPSPSATPSPQSSPTKAPTSPSAVATQRPSVPQPSAGETASPTPFPSPVSTLIPTPEPSPTPTDTPVPVPTPTSSPSATLTPTPPPSAVSTVSPTRWPTSPPTQEPSPQPTVRASLAPTRIPSPPPSPQPTPGRSVPAPSLPQGLSAPYPSPEARPAPLLRPVVAPPLPTWPPAPSPVARAQPSPALTRPTVYPTRWVPWPTTTLPPPPPFSFSNPTPWPTATPFLAQPRPQAWPTSRTSPRPSARRSSARRKAAPARARPSPTATAVPMPVVAAAPRPTVVLEESIRNALGCLSSAPEPFTDGGVYIQFCLSHAASVHLAVFDASGAQLWRSEDRDLAPGQQQWYFSASTPQGALAPGAYVYEVTAYYSPGHGESRQGGMTKVRPDRR